MEFVGAFLSEQTVERIGWVLIHFLWQGIAAGILTWCVLKVLSKASSNVRYIAACAGLVLMTTAPVTTFFILAPDTPVAAAPLSVEPVEEVAPIPVAVQMVTDKPVTAPAEPFVMPALTLQQRLMRRLEAALPYCVAGWFAGVAVLSVWYLGGWCQLQKLRRIGTRAVSDCVEANASLLCQRLGIRRAVRVVESALVQVPTMVGWLKPAVLLPATALTGLDEIQLQAMIAHELAHIKRCDYLVNIAQTIVEILGFYHPAVWWASRQIRIERENCCDDIAVSLVQNKKDYAGALFTMEAIRSKQHDLAVAANGGHLENRISRLTGKPAKSHKSGWVVAVILIGIIMTGCVLKVVNKPTQQTQDSNTDIGSTLEFRLVADISPEQADSIEDLDNRLDGYEWLPLKNLDENQWYKNLPYLEKDDKVYILVSDKKDEAMFADGSWGLEKTGLGNDNSHRPAVTVVFDERGKDKFYALTSHHVGRHLAICIDGYINSAPQVMTAIRSAAMITGSFTEQEAQTLADTLAEGMPATTPEETPDSAASEDIDLANVSVIQRLNMDEAALPAEVSRIWQVLEGTYRAVTRNDLQIFSTYLNPGMNEKDTFDDYSELLKLNPDWQFSLLSVYWDTHAAMAVTDKIKFGNSQVDGPEIIVFSLEKNGAEWRIVDIDLEEQDGLQIENARFLKEHPTAGTWFIEPGLGAVSRQPGAQYTVLRQGVRTAMDLTSGNIIDVPEDIASQTDSIAYLRSHCGCGIMFDHDGRMSNLVFINAKNVNQVTAKRDGFRVFSFVSKDVPQVIIVTSNDGSQYSVRIRQADYEGCTLEFEQIHQDDSPSSELADNSYTAILPNGATIELLGLGTAPWKDQQQWWRPDGTSMDPPELKFPHPLIEWKEQLNGAQFTCAALCEYSGDMNIRRAPYVKFSNGLVIGASSLGDGMFLVYITSAPFLGPIPETTDMQAEILSEDFDEPQWITFKSVALHPAKEVESEVQVADDRAETPFSVQGQVTDAEGRPIPEVTVRASCGMRTLMPTGTTVTDENGKYRLYFGPGFHVLTNDEDSSGVGFQAATIHAEKEGLYEANLCQHANLAMADSAAQAREHPWRKNFKGVVLPNQPYELNFVMMPAASISGLVTDPDGKPIPQFKFNICGTELYPSSSVLCNITTNGKGEFTLESLPLKTFWFDESHGTSSIRTQLFNLESSDIYKAALIFDEDRKTFQLENISLPSGERTVEGEIMLPEMDLLDLASGEHFSIIETLEEMENSQEGGPDLFNRVLEEKYGRGDICYDYKGPRGLIICVRGSDYSDQTSTGDPEVPIFEFEAENLPVSTVITTQNGDAYEVSVLEADLQGCKIKYRAVEKQAQADPEREILLKRREILRRRLQEVRVQLEYGRGSMRDLRQVQVDLLRTESELAATDAERIDYLQQILELYQQHAKTIQQMIDVGQVPESELDEIKLLILEVSREILQAKRNKQVAASATGSIQSIATRRQEESQQAWGEPIEGVQIRLRLDNPVWDQGHAPALFVDLRNNGTRDLSLAIEIESWEIEVDGKWYKPNNYYSGLRRYLPLAPGQQQFNVEVWTDRMSELNQLKAGKHTLRVARILPSALEGPLQEQIRVVSNPVEIDVKTSPIQSVGEEAWGEPVDGVSVRLRSPEVKWHLAAQDNGQWELFFRTDLKSGTERRLPHYGAPIEDFYAEVDGTLYKPNENFPDVRSVGPSPATVRENLYTYIVAKHWKSVSDGQPMPEFTPGKHTIRIGFPLLPENVNSTGRRPIAFSNLVEVVIPGYQQTAPVTMGDMGGMMTDRSSIDDGVVGVDPVPTQVLITGYLVEAPSDWPQFQAFEWKGGGDAPVLTSDQLDELLATVENSPEADLLSRPRILVNDNEGAEIRVGGDEDEGYMKLKTIPHVSATHEMIRIEIEYELSKLTNGDRSTMSMATMITLIPDHAAAIVGHIDGDDKTMLLLLKAQLPIPAPVEMRTVIYDIADILSYTGNNPKADEISELLKQTIIQTIATKSWADNGGKGRIDFPGENKYVIWQTPEVHEALQDYFKKYRDNLFKYQIAIETRILTVPDGFCEDIGLDTMLTGEDTIMDRTLGEVLVGLADEENILAALENKPLDQRVLPRLENKPLERMLPGAAGSQKISMLDDLEASFLLRAVQAHKGAKLLSAPKAAILDGEAACIQVQKEWPYKVSGDEIKYVNEGLTFDIQPSILNDTNALLKGHIQWSDVLADDSEISEFAPMMRVINIPFHAIVESSGTILIIGPEWDDSREMEISLPLLSNDSVLPSSFLINRIEDKKRMLILIKPTIVELNESPQDAIGLLAPSAGTVMIDPEHKEN